MLPGETLEQLRAIDWLDYTFEPDGAYIVARGPREVRFYYVNGHYSTFGESTIQYYSVEQMVGRLVKQASAWTQQAYISWAFAKKGITVIWYDETSGTVIRDIHSCEIRLTDSHVFISQGSCLTSSIHHLFRYTIDSLFPLPTSKPPETSREEYERLLLIAEQYKRECPFMSARYPYSFRSHDLMIAGLYVRHPEGASFKQLLYWERSYAIRDTIERRLPGPIAEEIAPHVL